MMLNVPRMAAPYTGVVINVSVLSLAHSSVEANNVKEMPIE
jgi:hypothetical protein